MGAHRHALIALFFLLAGCGNSGRDRVSASLKIGRVMSRSLEEFAARYGHYPEASRVWEELGRDGLLQRIAEEHGVRMSGAALPDPFLTDPPLYEAECEIGREGEVMKMRGSAIRYQRRGDGGFVVRLAGPDRRLDVGSAVPVLYDPTNGVVSEGDILDEGPKAVGVPRG